MLSHVRQKVSVPNVVAFWREVFRGRGHEQASSWWHLRNRGRGTTRASPEAIDVLAVAKQLSAEFERRAMRSHLKCLRQFVAGRKGGRLAVDQGSWSTDMVLTWAALLQVPPLHKLYGVGAAGAGCAQCTDTKAVVRIEISWTDGALVRCDACGFKWLQAH